MDVKTLLNRLYYIELNFDGADELYRKAKLQNKNITKQEVKDWLKEQSTHQQTTVKKVGNKNFKPIYSDDMYSFQMDLTFLPKYKSANDKYYIIFTAININSRYVYAYYAKDKKTDTIISMLDLFLKNAGIIHSITCDSGSEFISHEAEKWFNDNNIKIFLVVKESHKLGIINRFHRTLKDKLLKYFTANNSVRWIDTIDKIIYNYNHTINKGIGFTPTEASKGFIQSIIINNAIDKTNGIKDDDIKVGDKCRVENKKELFDKLQNKYSNEVYTIVKIKKNSVVLDNDKTVKKSDIIIVKNIDYEVVQSVKKEVEKKHKIKNKLDKEDVKNENIRESKREKKQTDYKKLNSKGF